MTILTMFDPSLTPCTDQSVLPSFTMAKAQGSVIAGMPLQHSTIDHMIYIKDYTIFT